MSLKTLPLLFINLGGEMIYILDQRLTAQNISKEKGARVIHDIVGTMFNKRFMEELFKPQELYSRKAMRTVFDRLAHASIMRLNQASMDKLYDLMTMAVKHQLSLSSRPHDVLMVTLNHVDAIRQYVATSDTVKQQVENVFKLIIKTYGRMSAGELMLCRQTLLYFLQDMHIRVSIFLKNNVQTNGGRFILPQGGPVGSGYEVPGSIRLFDSRGKQVSTKSFSAGGSWSAAGREGSLEARGNRGTDLGKNMYAVVKGSVEALVPGSAKSTTVPSSEIESAPPNPMAKAQLDFLSRLIGSEPTQERSGFRLNLFENDDQEEEAFEIRQASNPGSRVVNIDARKGQRSRELDDIMRDMTVADGASGQQDNLWDLVEED